jgi:hypothetical protein
MKTKLLILIVTVLVTASCSTVARIATNDSQVTISNKTNTSQIEVYSTKTAGKSYSIIGQVIASADAGENSNIAVDLLKEQASLLGADAIVDMRLSINMGYWISGITATGTAVKYK